MSDETRNIGGPLASTWVIHRADGLIDIGLMDDAEPDAAIRDECSLDGIGNRTGQMIGRYMLIRQLGEGGFGTVWLAEQRVPIHREVAVKFIKPGMDSRQVISKFETESQTLAMMQHPNIASVLDAGATPQGLPFFVMELVRGEPITTYCDRHQLSVRSRLLLFLDVCNAVQHAHLKAVLHRDLKPSNILVEEVDGLPVPKVIDFGIAKAISPPSQPMGGVNPTYTLSGAVVGTPEYMSPEQAAGDPDVDTRSDTYALGAILYELLTGQPPLADHKLHTLPLDKVLHVIKEVEPAKPSLAVLRDKAKHTADELAAVRQSEPRRLTVELQGDLDQILLKALEKDRHRRYESAAMLGDDIRRHLQDQPVSARAPTRVYILRKLIRRNKTLFFSGVLSSVALLAALASAIWGYIREQQALKKALQAELNARDSDSKSQRVSLFLGNLFRDISLRNNATMTPGALRELLENANNRRINELQNQPETDKRVSIDLAEAFLELDKLESAENLYDNAIHRLDELGQLETAEAADCLFWLAWCQLQRAERDGARDAGAGPVELVKKCIDIRSRLSSVEEVDAIKSNTLLASAYRQAQRLDLAEELLKSLDSGPHASKARASSAYGWILRERAIIHRLKGESEQALHDLEDARKNLINSAPSSNHRLQVQADIHRLTCEVYMQISDWEAALETAQAELGERLDWLGWEDPVVLLRIAEIHVRREAPNEAIASLKRTISMAVMANRSDVHEQALHRLIGLLKERHDGDQSELISTIVELVTLLLSRHDQSLARGVPSDEILADVSKLLDEGLQAAPSPPACWAPIFGLRASLLVRKRDYLTARNELEMAAKLEPDDYRHKFRLAVLCLAANDLNAYEQLRLKLIRSLKSQTRRDSIIWSMRAILLHPDSGHSIPQELCESLLRNESSAVPSSSASDEDWIPLLLGMTAYRLGHHSDAQNWFEYVQSNAKRTTDTAIPIYNQLFMAMNSHHLHLDEEPRALVEAQMAFDEQFQPLEGTDSQPAFHDILSAKILREEAELTILGRATQPN